MSLDTSSFYRVMISIFFKINIRRLTFKLAKKYRNVFGNILLSLL